MLRLLQQNQITIRAIPGGISSCALPFWAPGRDGAKKIMMYLSKATLRRMADPHNHFVSAEKWPEDSERDTPSGSINEKTSLERLLARIMTIVSKK